MPAELTQLPNNSDVIAGRLREAGCRHCFGIPGGEVLTLMEALNRAGVEFVLTRHETGAGFMAEGTHHVTGAPGVLLATLGPGVANTVNAVANAMLDRVPMIVLTGCLDENETRTYTHQIFDHQAVLKPITKASFRLTEDNVGLVMDKALAIATADRPGPVHIDIPIPVSKAPAHEVTRPRATRDLATQIANESAIETVRPLLAQAQRPLMVVGLDVLNQNCDADVRWFFEQTGIPTITTYKAKGVVDENAANALGAAGLSPKADEILLPLTKQADVVLLAGYDPIEMRVGWRNPFAESATVIDIGAEGNTHNMHRSDHQIVAHVGMTLHRLADGLPAKLQSWPGDAIAKTRAQLQSAFAPQGQWGPDQAIDVLGKTVAPDIRVSVDTGAHRILLSQMWRSTVSHRLLQSSALCTMGCALPLAIGTAIAQNNGVPTIAVVGDGGLEMGLGELGTLRDCKQPVVVVVFDDRSLALIEKKQRAMGLPNLGVDFGAEDFAGTDYGAVAKAFGAAAHRAENAEQLRVAMQTSLGHKGPSLIHCVLPRRAYDQRI